VTLPLRPRIGLEIHVRLATRTKLFCSCENRFGAPPNSLVCPTCLGLPGSLPHPNRTALELALRAALAFGSEIARRQSFDRKHYFYPDLPKGYQCTQQRTPLARGGSLTLPDGRTVSFLRLHLEEDAGKSLHAGRKTWIDLNRAGTPLLELVTEPTIRSPKEARLFLTILRRRLRWLRVSDGDMEKGSLRCDANVSLDPGGARNDRNEEGAPVPRIEIKNLNSFRRVEAALDFEIERLRELARRGVSIRSETRSWDEKNDRTRHMRWKGEAPDYRYLPEPDIPPFRIDEEVLESLRLSRPESPRLRAERFSRDHGIPLPVASELCMERESADWFEALVEAGAAPDYCANWLRREFRSCLRRARIVWDEIPFLPGECAKLLRMLQEGTLSPSAGRRVLEAMCSPLPFEEALARVGRPPAGPEPDLDRLVEEACRRRPEALEDWRRGKENAVHALIGEAMRLSGGYADPKALRARFDARRAPGT